MQSLAGLQWFIWSLLPLTVTCRKHPVDPTRRCEPPKSQGDLNSFLWTIKREPPAYMFGTIHVPYTRVWDFIPDNSKRAFRESSSVYFELDLTDPYTISALASCQMLPHGENLQDVLPRDLYRRLKRHLEYVKVMMPYWMTPDQRGKGLYADYLFNAIAGNWERKRPVWVMLMVNSLTETDIRSRGVPVLDLYLAQEAERMRKRTGAVERVEEQCHPLNGLNFSQHATTGTTSATPGLRVGKIRARNTGAARPYGQFVVEVVFALNQTLLQHESLRAGSFQAPYTTEDLIKHYNCGDLNAVIFNHDTSQLPNFINTTLPPHEQVTAQEIDSYFRQELIYKRNERMAKRVMGLLRENRDRSFFFAFGAGHFLGNHTVIDVLKRGGFEVEHTPAGQPFRKSNTDMNPSPEDNSATVKYSEEAPSSSSAPFEYDDDILPPHLLLPDSISQLEEFGRQKRWHKKEHKHHRQRQFNDLWVRIEDSTTTLPSHIRITNGYITADYPVWVSNRLNHRPRLDHKVHNQPKSGASRSYTTPLIPAFVCLAAVLSLTSLLRPS